MKIIIKIKDLKEIHFIEIIEEKVEAQTIIKISGHYIFLLVLFFVSGFAALIYQVVWQRVLFTLFGSDTESTTVIVSVFMLGLGLGSLMGGVLSRKFHARLVETFSLIELSIGLYGFFSILIIHTYASLSVDIGLTGTALFSLAILFIPTICMGASLPVLVTYINREILNAGTSVANLYLYNTLGSAVASIATVLIFFEVLGLSLTVKLASILNFLVAVTIFIIYGLRKKK